MLKIAEKYVVVISYARQDFRKLGVTVPGQGDWAKLAYGHSSPGNYPLPRWKTSLSFTGAESLIKCGRLQPS